MLSAKNDLSNPTVSSPSHTLHVADFIAFAFRIRAARLSLYIACGFGLRVAELLLRSPRQGGPDQASTLARSVASSLLSRLAARLATCVKSEHSWFVSQLS